MNKLRERIQKSSINFMEILSKFRDENSFIKYYESIKYPTGMFCPRCEKKQIYKVKGYNEKRPIYLKDGSENIK